MSCPLIQAPNSSQNKNSYTFPLEYSPFLHVTLGGKNHRIVVAPFWKPPFYPLTLHYSQTTTFVHYLDTNTWEELSLVDSFLLHVFCFPIYFVQNNLPWIGMFFVVFIIGKWVSL